MKNISLALAFLAAGLGFSSAGAQNRLVNGSFEDRVVTAADTCQGAPWCVRSFLSTPGWTQFADGVDLVNNNYAQPPPVEVLVSAFDGVNFLDMNQAGALGGLFQTVSATDGEQFHLSLETTAWAKNSRGGTIGYQLYDPASNAVLASGSFTDNTGGTWVLLTLDTTAISNSIGVRIQGLLATQAAMGLDNVVLIGQDVPPVPEPDTYALLMVGLSAMGFVARRRKQKA